MQCVAFAAQQQAIPPLDPGRHGSSIKNVISKHMD